MNPEIYAEWLKRQGFRVFHSESSYWFNAGPRVYQAFPFQWLIEPSSKELMNLVTRSGAIALRYSKLRASSSGKISYHVILHSPYDLENLRSNARNGIRKGLSSCSIEQVSFTRLADEGWKLQHQTLSRHGRCRSMTSAQWESCCLSAEGLPGFEAWAAIVGGSLAATVITARIGDTWTIPYAQSLTEFQCLHVNNALFYTICKDFLSRPGIREVFTNVQSLDSPESVDEFKFRMGFVPKSVRQEVFFTPWAGALIGSASYEVVKKLHQWIPKSSFWAKTEGMLRFYIEGKLPQELQALPFNLKKDSDDCCA